MKRFAASDLSADLALELSSPSPAQEMVQCVECARCQIEMIHLLFRQALACLEQLTEGCSWRMHRAKALLSPMYLEVIQEVEHDQAVEVGADDLWSEELLLAATRWRQELEADHCNQHADRSEEYSLLVKTALEGIKMILSEILRG